MKNIFHVTGRNGKSDEWEAPEVDKAVRLELIQYKTSQFSKVQGGYVHHYVPASAKKETEKS